MNTGIRLRVTALVVLTSIPPVILVGWVGVTRNQAALRLSAGYQHTVLAERLRGELTGGLERSQRELQQVASELLSPRDEALTLASITHQLDSEDAPFFFVTLYDSQGKRRGSVRRSDVTEEGPLELPPGLRGEGPQLGRPQRKGNLFVLPMAHPGVDLAGEPVWAYTEMPLQRWLSEIEAVSLRPPLRSSSAVQVVDATGVLATGAGFTEAKPAALFTALEGGLLLGTDTVLATEFNDSDGTPMLGVLATVPALSWGVIVQRPQSDAYAELAGLRLFVAVLVFAMVVTTLALAFAGARWLTAPLSRLVDATRQLAERRFERVDATVSSRGDEVGALGRAFDDMSSALAKSEAAVVAETKTRAALARFLPPEVVERAIAKPEAMGLGGERRLVTVLFADVVGFTRLSEQLAPETIVAFLNELFTVATEIVHARGGMVDKFIGDCVMAVWGLPEASANDAVNAVAAADELRRWVETGNRRWKRLWGIEVKLAMGLHTGFVVAGNVGGERRMEYTVIGDTVNIAARLEAAAAPGQILVSDATQEHLAKSPLEIRSVGSQTLRGRASTTSVFEVCS